MYKKIHILRNNINVEKLLRPFILDTANKNIALIIDFEALYLRSVRKNLSPKTIFQKSWRP